ncbi:MAG: YdeI/OmpD-associated family protein [Bacteroidales bacterium]|nr:YdeI/OmpD-associated family protein [Bacteroidales bacterium]
METIFCKNRDEWRAWLINNHAFSSEIWLIYYKKHTKKPTVAYNDAVEEALCFGWIDSIVKRIDDETYMQKYTPRKRNSIWSLVNKKRVEKMISEGKMTKIGLDQVDIAKKNGHWEKAYSSNTNIEIPNYLEKALKANKTAWENFNNFAKSYKNIYVGWVVSAKRQETKEKRISVVVARSEKNKKPEML